MALPRAPLIPSIPFAGCSQCFLLEVIQDASIELQWLEAALVVLPCVDLCGFIVVELRDLEVTCCTTFHMQWPLWSRGSHLVVIGLEALGHNPGFHQLSQFAIDFVALLAFGDLSV